MIPSTLSAHLNVNWLRPESALWDAIASDLIARIPFVSPSVDFGSGNGLFSFITAGGVFSEDYDWYHNADPRGFFKNRDIYDAYRSEPPAGWIQRRPRYAVDWAYDSKMNLLRQASHLGFYGQTLRGDGNKKWRFADGSLRTFFSNILYWLASPEKAFHEMARVVGRGGRAIVCLPTPEFQESCPSYQWRQKKSPLLRLLNRGRLTCLRWSLPTGDLRTLARRNGFRVLDVYRYLTPLTLRIWDVGLRPLSPVLIKMARRLSPVHRREIKTEWINTVRPFAEECYRLEQKACREGRFNLFVFERK